MFLFRLFRGMIYSMRTYPLMLPQATRCWWCGAPGAAPLYTFANLPARLCGRCGLRAVV
jgi:hypothetical protein